MSGLVVGCEAALDCPDGEMESHGECSPREAEVTESQEPDPSAATTGSVARSGAVEPLPAQEPVSLCINEFMAANATSLMLHNATPDWIEIHNPTEDPISLEGWSISDDPAEPGRHTFSEGLSISAGSFLLLLADGSPDLGPAHLDFRLSVEGESLILTSPSGAQRTLHFPELERDASAARTTDCCRGEGCWRYEWMGTPGGSNEEPAEKSRELDLLTSGSDWRYHAVGGEVSSTWASASYDDSSWAVGEGPLGYGDTHIATLLAYGTDPFSKPMTTYFRSEFQAEDPATLEDLTFWLMRDDGAVVYLNGVEVLRSNMPAGDIGPDTPATETVWEASDETTYVGALVGSEALIEGTNQLAVEVHQATPDSSDLGFDLAVTAQRGDPTGPSGGGAHLPWVPSETLPAYSPILPRPCPEIYDPETLPEFSIEIGGAEWASLTYEYAHGGYGPLNTELKPYHPLDSFVYEGEVISDAEIRLKGWPGSFVDWGKMQFVIRFNGVDSSGRFQGLRHLALDSPYYEPSLLRERLSLTYFHEDLGLPGSCVNNARLMVNGEFYGLYTNVEYPDEELLERLFGNDGPDAGFLYKYVPDIGWKLKEGGEEFDLAAIEEFYTLYEAEPIAEVVDVESLLRFAAAEATLPDEDNYFVGSINFLWYQHPERGWMPLPWDHDWSFFTWDLDPRDPPFTWLNEHLWVLVHSPWFAEYEMFLQESVAAYDPSVFVTRLHLWAAQVRASVQEDPYLSDSEFEAEVTRLEAFFWARQEHLDAVMGEL